MRYVIGFGLVLVAFVGGVRSQPTITKAAQQAEKQIVERLTADPVRDAMLEIRRLEIQLEKAREEQALTAEQFAQHRRRLEAELDARRKERDRLQALCIRAASELSNDGSELSNDGSEQTARNWPR